MASFRSHLISLLVKVSRLHKKFEDEGEVRALINDEKSDLEAPVPRSLRRRFHVEERRVGERPVIHIRAKTERRRRHVIYLHGGAYVSGIVKPHWDFLARLMKAANCDVTVPLYGLAPSHTCKDVFSWLVPMYSDLLEDQGSDPIFLMGDSAGGGLALALAQVLRAESIPQPAGVVMLSPWLDLAMDNPEIAEVEKNDVMLTSVGLKVAAELWAGELPLDDPRLSPIHGALEGLAPLCLFMGTHDLLWPDAKRFKALAEAEKELSFRYHEAEGMMHVWALLPMPEGHQALSEMVTFMEAPTTPRS